MKNLIKELISETGSISTLRVMSLTSLLVASVIAIYAVLTGMELGPVTSLVSVFIGAAFMGKVGQRYVEGKDKPDA